MSFAIRFLAIAHIASGLPGADRRIVSKIPFLALQPIERFLPAVVRKLGQSISLILCALLVCSPLCLLPASASAQDDSQSPSWQATIAPDAATPPRIVAVDKKRQQLFLFELGKSMRLSSTYVCTTGQNTGDKQVQGDLKTPEGIYFVVQHLNSGLDFTLYGKEAYTLNYPNPMDRLRRKTGYGIWIHGRGEAISPLQTQGCVAMNNNDLEVLGKMLTPGTPVMLSSSLAPASGPATETSIAQSLEKRVQAWAKAWGQRSQSMFDFYDKDSYSIAQGEPFSRFQTQKERLFKTLPWIKTSVRDIQVLQGPGYWVTWFYQEYTAPNLSTEGVRRLYWTQDGKGEFRILGMEWVPGMTTGTLMASAEPATPPVDTVPRSEEQATPLPQAVAAASKNKPETESPLTHPPSATTTVSSTPQPVVTAHAVLESKTSSAAVNAPGATDTDSSPTTSQYPGHAALNLPPPIPAQRLATQAENSAGTATHGSSSAPSARSNEISNAGAPSGSKTETEADSPLSLLEQKTADSVTITPIADDTPQSLPPASALAAVSPQGTRSKQPPISSIITDNTAAQPVQAIQNPIAKPSVSDSTVKPSESNSVAKLSAADAVPMVAEVVESWRKAWKAGDLDGYMQFYALSAVQGERRSASSIKRHKQHLWARHAPATVVFNDIRIVTQDEKTAQVDMIQEYTDAEGNRDKGKKSLTMRLIHGRWVITDEDWSKLTQ